MIALRHGHAIRCGLLLSLLAVMHPPAAAADNLSRARILTTAEFAGRGNGTAEVNSAADTLASWLSAAGLRPGFGESWQQEFTLKGLPENRLASGYNIAGLWPGHGELAERTVLVTAHYDHLGRVDSSALGVPQVGAYYPGANDNASGVAIVLDLIARLTAASAPNDLTAAGCRSVLFVFFSGEEIGLQGSAHFVSAPPVPLSAIDVVLNFDTVGVITDDKLYISGLGSAPALTAIVAATAAGDLQLAPTQNIWSGSDHMSFVTQKIPSLFVFGGPYENYNRTTDSWQNLSENGLLRVAEFARDLLQRLVVHQPPISWQTGYEPIRSHEPAGAENRDTWFGSLPDFGSEVLGYALAGVFDGSPAAQAGLSKGDVIVAMNGHEITGLVDFTSSLRSHNPGDLLEVVVLRQKLELRFTVVLGSRKDRP